MCKSTLTKGSYLNVNVAFVAGGRENKNRMLCSSFQSCPRYLNAIKLLLTKYTYKDYPKRWITWLVGRWRTQLIARQLVNCRTHEHRHFERTLRSLDTVPGPLLAEGRFNFHDCPVCCYTRLRLINKCRGEIESSPQVAYTLRIFVSSL